VKTPARLLRSLLLLLCLVALAAVHAATPPAWLAAQLTPEARAWKNSEPAVMLCDELVCRQLAPDRVELRARGAILIHKAEQVGARATAVLPYNGRTGKIISLRGWLVAPDGKKTTAITRAQFIDVASADPRMWQDQRVLAYTSGAPLADGTVLAWEFVVENETGPLDTIDWSARPLPTLRAEVSFYPLPGAVLSWHAYNPTWPAPIIDPVGGRHTWRVQALVPFTGQGPAGFRPRRDRLSLRCSPDAATAGRLADWPGLARAFYALVAPNLLVTPELRARAEALVAGKTERWARVRALTEFVQRQVSYLSVAREDDYLAGCRPQAADATLKNRMGDCKDKAALLIALLSAIGEEAHVVLLYAGDPRQVRSEWPGNTFNHAIVALSAGADVPANWPVVAHPTLGRLLIIDATTVDGALGLLPASDQLGQALVLHPERGGLVALPGEPAAAGGAEVRARLALAANGDATVKLREILRGRPALQEQLGREAQGEARLRERAESRLRAGFTLVSELKAEATWEPAAVTLAQKFGFFAPRLGRRVGRDLLLVTPACSRPPPALPAWQTDTPGSALLFQESIRDEVRVTLPAGCTVEEWPPARRGEHAGAHFEVTCVAEASGAVYRAEFFQPAGLFEKEDYAALRALRQSYLHARTQPLVLKLTDGAPPESGRLPPR
jgi:hypothetical protein